MPLYGSATEEPVQAPSFDYRKALPEFLSEVDVASNPIWDTLTPERQREVATNAQNVIESELPKYQDVMPPDQFDGLVHTITGRFNDIHRSINRAELTPKPPSPEGALGSFGTELSAGFPAALATGVAGAGAATLAIPSGPIGMAAADIAAGAAAGAGVEAINQNADPVGYAREQLQREVNRQQHPVASGAASMVNFLVSAAGGGTQSRIVKDAAGRVLGRATTEAGEKALLAAAQAGKRAIPSLVERVAPLLVKGARTGAEQGATAKYVQGRDDVSVIDSAVRSALGFAATGLIPWKPPVDAAGFLPASKQILAQAGIRGTTDALAMTLADHLYDATVHGKPMSWKKFSEDLGGSIPAFVLQNAIMHGAQRLVAHGARAAEAAKPHLDAAEASRAAAAQAEATGMPQTAAAERSLADTHEAAAFAAYDAEMRRVQSETDAVLKKQDEESAKKTETETPKEVKPVEDEGKSLQEVSPQDVGVQVRQETPKVAPKPTWMDEALAERRAKGWDDKWPFVPADLQNKDFVEAIRNDPSIAPSEKAKIMAFVPEAYREPVSTQPTAPVAARQPDKQDLKVDAPNDGLPPESPGTGMRVISTAIKTANGLKVGSKWNQGHDEIAKEHGLQRPPEDQRGFIVEMGGSKVFEGRYLSGQIARISGQSESKEDLHSSDLRANEQPEPKPLAAEERPPAPKAEAPAAGPSLPTKGLTAAQKAAVSAYNNTGKITDAVAIDNNAMYGGDKRSQAAVEKLIARLKSEQPETKAEAVVETPAPASEKPLKSAITPALRETYRGEVAKNGQESELAKKIRSNVVKNGSATDTDEAHQLLTDELQSGAIDRAIARLEAARKKPNGTAQLEIFPLMSPASFRAIWNTGIDIAIGVLKATRSVARAIAAALEHFRSTGHQFDEAAAKEALESHLLPSAATPQDRPMPSNSSEPSPGRLRPLNSSEAGAVSGDVLREGYEKAKELAAPGLDILRDMKDGIASLVAPTTKSPEHLAAAELIGARLGEMHHRQESLNDQVNPFWRLFERKGVNRENMPQESNPGVQFMSDMSTGKEQTGKLKELADIKEREDRKRIDLLDEADAPILSLRENYMKGIWTEQSRKAFNFAMEQARTEGIIPEGMGVNDTLPEQRAWVKSRVDEALKNGTASDKDALGYLTKTPLLGRQSFRKQKVFDQDIRTAFEFGLRPASYNPVDIMKLGWAELDRHIMAQQVIKDLKDKGQMQIARLSEQPPEGWQYLNDKYGNVWGPREIEVTSKNSRLLDEDGNQIDPADVGLDGIPPEGTTMKVKVPGMMLMGRRIVPNAVGDVLNNYLSSSLYNNQHFGKLFTGWMAAANALNQFQLGVGSAFHAGFTTAEAQISAGANVIKDVFGVLRGNRTAGQLAQTGYDFLRAVKDTFSTGNRLLNAWRDPNAVIDPKMAKLVRATELAGGGFTMERGLMTEQHAKMERDWFSGHRVRAALRSPIAATELMAHVLMKGLVPRQKAGVWAHLANRIIEQNPGKTLEELTPQFRQAWNRVDSRLGQVRYDRLFAHNAAKNFVQGVVRAPGWTGGTIAELGGAFKDMIGFFRQWAKDGKLPSDVPDRVAYAISLGVGVTLLNGLLTYAFTGQQPTDKDWWAFRTGGKDERGNPERFILPTYMKDVIAYKEAALTTLVDKAHPILSLIGDIIKNRDYYGVEVRHEDDNAAQQIAQTGKYVAKAFVPFWIRGEQKLQERGESGTKMIAPMIGVMPAPRKLTDTPAMKLVSEINKSRIPAGSITEQKHEQNVAKAHAKLMASKGDYAELRQLIREKKITEAQASTAIKLSKLPPIVASTYYFSADQMKRVMEKADDHEKALLKPWLALKQQREAKRGR